jgi:electron transfer flavoprotein alpha subunit
MAGTWAVGELVEGRPTRLTLELATLAAGISAGDGEPATVVLVGASAAAASEVARCGPHVVSVATPQPDGPVASVVALALASLIDARQPEVVLIGASPEGKDVAGILIGLTDMPVLVAASRVARVDDRLTVEMGAFGGRVVTRSSFCNGGGVVLVRPGSVTAEPAAAPGAVEEVTVEATRTLAPVRLVEHVEEAAVGPSIDDARVIVGAGRGVGGAEGLPLVEELAAVIGGAVGATRAAVDAGWIDFNQQIGQTGKTVKPDLYIACGISGAIQHSVGVQSAGTIVAIDKDLDAPIVGFADLVVVGDLFEIVPRLTAALRARADAGS